MSLVLIVWLVNTVIPGLGVVAAVSMFVMVFATIVLVIHACVEGTTEGIKRAKPFIKWAVLATVLAVCIPTKETTWYMVGAYGTQKLIENPAAQELASDGVDVLKALMKKAKDNLEEKPVK